MRQLVGGGLHSYATDFKFTPHVHVLLAACAVGLYVLLKPLPLPNFVAVRPLFAFTIFGLLEFAFRHWWWRLLCRLPGLQLHDFSGIYEGSIRSGSGSAFPAKLTVKQNWSHVELYFQSGEATSRSFSASITHDRVSKGQVEIIYNYFAPGTHEGEERVGAHYGTALLKRMERGATLEGEYFTERSRDSFGYIAVTRRT